MFPNALLVDEVANRSENELDSKYITVTRVFETLPGPEVPSKRYNERGDLESISTQVVVQGTPPTEDGLLITGSQVIQQELGKGVKTTSSVTSHSTLRTKEKKEGLLGETITTDDIVDPSTNPDALSQSIIASVVQQTSATKAVKRTTTASGPTSLTQKNKDGKLIGDITITESVVAPSESPDSVSNLILSSEVKQVDSGKAIKRNIILNSTPTLLGSDFKGGLLGQTNVSEIVVAAGSVADSPTLSIVSSSVEPIDSIRSRKVTVTASGPTTLSGGQKKDGLLGETNVEESIVEAGTEADQLSQIVVSSSVEPIDSAKSKKTTIIATGPTSLAKKSKDGKLLGDVTSIESIVAPNTTPDDPSETIISSEVKQIDSGKAVKTNVVLNSTPTLLGNQSGEGLLGSKTTTETIVLAGSEAEPVSLSVISSQVEPIDSVRSRRVTTESNGPISLTGNQKKEGLLGEVTIVESIVPSGTEADNLSSNIISSSISPIDSAKSKKTTISSSGPSTLSGRRINQRGEIEIVDESIVTANSNPDPDSVNTVSSEVNPIDVAKSKKTTVSVERRLPLLGKKSSSGLLGNTSFTEEIVPDNEEPEDLFFSGKTAIIESSVEPISATKARKTITNSSGPFNLKSDTFIESPLGLVKATIEKSIVRDNTNPSINDTTGLKIVKDSINSLDETKSERELVKVENWPKNVSVDYDQQLGIGIYFEETIVSPNEYSNNPEVRGVVDVEYKAIDQWKSIKKEIDIERVSEALLNQYYKIPTQVKIKLPDKLKSTTCYLANSYGAGQDFKVSGDAGTGSFNRSDSGSSRSSWSIGGDIYFEIENGFEGDVPGFKHIFFIQMKGGRVSAASILDTLNTFSQNGSQEGEISNSEYQRWPYIKTKTENIVLITGGRSLSKSTSQSESAGINGFSKSEGSGTSFDVNVNANSILVPQTIHPAITINVQEVNDVDDNRGVQRPTTSVQPPILNATTPSIFPTGNFLMSADAELYKWGFLKVTAITATITTSEI
jgi:hypothetical protein